MLFLVRPPNTKLWPGALRDWTDLALRAGLVQVWSDAAQLWVRKAEPGDTAKPPRILLGRLQST